MTTYNNLLKGDGVFTRKEFKKFSKILKKMPIIKYRSVGFSTQRFIEALKILRNKK